MVVWDGKKKRLVRIVLAVTRGTAQASSDEWKSPIDMRTVGIITS